MWFVLALLATAMLVSRRSAEKHVAGNVNSLAMAWLQQAFAMPFLLGSLLFSRFYWPWELPSNFWLLLAVYVVLISLDIYCYFKALSLADVSFIAPLMTLVAISNITGAYFVLGQVPSAYGLLGAVLIVAGAAITYRSRGKHPSVKHTNRLALGLVLLLVATRGFNSNIEVFMLRDSNPATFNFYSSVLTVPLIFATSLVIIASNRKGKYANYWSALRASVTKHHLLLFFIGLTYTINMLATYQAKLVGPNAGYVGAIKSASVLPMMLVGLLVFKEKIVRAQWLGLGLILIGLVLLAFN